MSTAMKTTLRVGLLTLLMGSVVAVATRPQADMVPLEGAHYGSAVKFELGLVAATLGLLLVLLSGIAYGMQRFQSSDRANRPDCAAAHRLSRARTAA